MPDSAPDSHADKLRLRKALGPVTLWGLGVGIILASGLERPYRTPLYPVLPLIALILAIFALATMTYFNIDRQQILRSHSLWYFGYVVVAFAYYFIFVRGRLSAADLAHFERIE